MHVFLWTKLGNDIILSVVKWFQSFSNEERFETSEAAVKKMCCLIPSILFQIYMVCYLFGNIHDQVIWIHYLFSIFISCWSGIYVLWIILVFITIFLFKWTQLAFALNSPIYYVTYQNYRKYFNNYGLIILSANMH